MFCVTYLVIASRQLQFLKLDRPAGATIGAVAMVVIGGLPMDDALHAIDLHVLILLFGVLLIAAYLTEAQFFKLAAYHVLTRAKNARSRQQRIRDTLIPEACAGAPARSHTRP